MERIGSKGLQTSEQNLKNGPLWFSCVMALCFYRRLNYGKKQKSGLCLDNFLKFLPSNKFEFVQQKSVIFQKFRFWRRHE